MTAQKKSPAVEQVFHGSGRDAAIDRSGERPDGKLVSITYEYHNRRMVGDACPTMRAVSLQFLVNKELYHVARRSRSTS